METTYKQPEPETIASAQALASYWKGLADNLSRENQEQATRIAELEGALRALEWRAGNHVAALVTMGRDPGKLSAACENARRVLGGGK